MTAAPGAVTLSPIESRSVDPGSAVGWWAEAWTLFCRDPLRWVALGVLLMLGVGLLGLVPWLGALVTAALSPVLMGGWVLAAHQVRGGAALDMRSVLVAGFQGRHRRPLLTLGAALAGATLLLMAANVLLGVSAVLGPVGVDAPQGAPAQAAMRAGMLALLLLLAFSLLVTAALWFAPALVVLRGASPGEAALASLRAVRDNALTFLIYALVQLILLAVVATLPYQVGWLVLLPVMLLTGWGEHKLWPAQITAIRNLERSLALGKPRSLIQMATGSGKTFTAISFIYRLIKYAGARRVLFLVDRGNLGRQTKKEFDQYVSPVTRASQ